MNDYYWEIIRKDEPPVYIPPDKVEQVNKLWKAKEPIPTTNETVQPYTIIAFRISAKRYFRTPLLEEAAQAFNSPVLTDEGIQARWVKRLVPRRMYDKHYGSIPGYHMLSEQNGLVFVAYRLPVHLINLGEVEYCSQHEIERLTTDKY